MPDTMMQTEATTYRNRSAEIKDLAAALVKAQAALEGAKKDAKAVITGTQTRTYADLASVWEAVRKPLTDNDLCVVQFPRTAGNGVEIETTLMHGATGQFMSDVLWVPCGKNDAQGLGSAITYGRRYALMAVVGVCPVDDDGAAASQGVAGSAGGGTHFRPERRQMPAQSSANGREMAQQEPQLVDHNRQKGKLPAAPGQAAPINTPAAAGNAIKRLEWVKASVAFLKDDSTDEHLARDWWAENKARVDVIETALPTEYERLLDAYNEAIERKVDA